MTRAVLSEMRGAALWLTIDRPDRRNALNNDVFNGLQEGLARSAGDPAVHAVVITGSADKAFCAGGDLDPDRSPAAAATQGERHPAGLAFQALLEHAKPVIARVNGACLAGGMGLLAAADLAVAAPHASFGLPEVKIGLFPMMVASLLIHRVGISDRDLCELSLLGDPVDARRAVGMRLITCVAEEGELDVEVERLVATLASRSPNALRAGKAALSNMRSLPPLQSLVFAEEQIGLLGQSSDAREGILAFSQKRAPAWGQS